MYKPVCQLRLAAARGNTESTLRGKATNIASRGSRAQSIHGLRERRVLSVRNRIYSTVFLKLTETAGHYMGGLRMRWPLSYLYIALSHTEQTVAFFFCEYRKNYNQSYHKHLSF
jgi:hypothetical protein